MKKLSLTHFMTLCSLGLISAAENAKAENSLVENSLAENNAAVSLTAKNKAILMEFMDEIWNKGNLKLIAKFISFPYVIHHDPGDPWEGQHLDLVTFKKRVYSSRQVISNLHFSIHSTIAEGDQVALSWHLHGTHKGNLPGLPASGKEVNVSGLTIYKFANGKITGHWQIVDRLGFMQQISPKMPIQ